jgi:ribosomal protein S18 acetylase RimI-like enzyme
MSVTIRELIPEPGSQDESAFVPAWLAIWNDPANLPFLSLTGRPFEEEWIRERLEARIASGVRYFAAGEESTEAILVTVESPIEGFELLGLGVRPESKRRGFGLALVRHGVGTARDLGYRAVDAKVFANNAAMLCLLLKEGFLPVRMQHGRGPAGEDLLHLKAVL